METGGQSGWHKHRVSLPTWVSHFGELHVMPTATFTDATWQPDLLSVKTFIFGLVVAPKKTCRNTRLAAILHAG